MGFTDIFWMVRDFSKVVRGKDYFHARQAVGLYFEDNRSYYNDFRCKYPWPGAESNGIPLLSIPRLGTSVAFPIMILQYGLGALDTWHCNGDTVAGAAAVCVFKWIKAALADNDSFENYFPTLHPHESFYSANSGMAQGECLSFLYRIEVSGLLSESESVAIRGICSRVYSNMVLPLNEGGTLLEQDGSEFFCEMCRTESYTVLNGWIYALWGVYDHAVYGNSEQSKVRFIRGIESLENNIDSYLLKGGWTFYDSDKRLSSPYYQRLHADLLVAIGRLADSRKLIEVSSQVEAGFNSPRKWYYLTRKILDRLLRKSLYSR